MILINKKLRFPIFPSQTSTRDQITYLRHWAHEHFYLCSRDLLLWDEVSRSTSHVKTFSLLTSRRGGVFCSGIAFALQQLYTAYGIKSFIYDCGTSNTDTHSLVLAYADNALSLQDPTFDVTFEREGRLMDIGEILESVTSANIPPSADAASYLHIVTSTPWLKRRNIVDGPHSENGLFYWISYEIPSNYHKNLSIPCPEFWEEAGLPDDFWSILFFPICLKE